MGCSKMALSCGFQFTRAEGKINYNQLETRDPFIPKPLEQIKQTWLPMVIKTNTADGPLCGYYYVTEGKHTELNWCKALLSWHVSWP